MTAAMLTILLFELGVAAAAGLAFVGIYVASPWRRSAAGRHMMAVAAVMALEAGALLAAGLRLPVPLWAFTVLYGAADLVVIHRLVLLWRARRLERRTERAEPSLSERTDTPSKGEQS